MNRLAIFMVAALSAAALADIDVGSDGSDGVFHPLTDVTIDLALAATASWDTPSPVAGQGVYDPHEWAVVFKYSSITIPAGVTVRFTNHPSRAPVVWLSQGDVVIAGTVNLDGASSTGAIPPSYAEPGPGGFRGGRRDVGGTSGSNGLGPGGGAFPQWDGRYAGHYGNDAILPLIGGSGGRGGSWHSGGAGGGAILIGANTTILVNGLLTATGGPRGPNDSGNGSGGAIRLVADGISGGGALRAGTPTKGRIRVEANAVELADPGDPLFVQDLPSFIFPPSGAPRLRATVLNGKAIPADPQAVIGSPYNVDVAITSCDAVTLEIEAENVPLGTTVTVRVVRASGPRDTFTSTPLTGTFESSSATAQVTFAPGYSVVQLGAQFDLGREWSRADPPASVPWPLHAFHTFSRHWDQQRVPAALTALTPALRDLRTLNGERVTGVRHVSAGSGKGRVHFVTETGRQIPVDVR